MDNIYDLAKSLLAKNIEPADYKEKENFPRDRLFLLGYACFVLHIKNENTKKHYRQVIDHFIRFMYNIRRVTPLDAIGIDVLLWKEDLFRTGGVAGAAPGTNLDFYFPEADTSVHNKLAVISALYRYLQKPGLDGSEPLLAHNPVDALSDRVVIERYNRSKKISRKLFKEILESIDVTTIKGLRDYVLLYGYFVTGRRNSEWVTLQWGQLNLEREPAVYTFTRKGQKPTTDELPDRLKNLLFKYLEMKWGTDFDKKVSNDTYLFTAIEGRGGARQMADPNHPLTQRMMLKIIKNYAKKVGIDTKLITVHSLRHLHAETYLEAGASVEEVRARLRHQSLATTQRYVSSMTNEKNRLSEKLDEMIGLPQVKLPQQQKDSDNTNQDVDILE